MCFINMLPTTNFFLSQLEIAVFFMVIIYFGLAHNCRNCVKVTRGYETCFLHQALRLYACLLDACSGASERSASLFRPEPIML
jgi:hypothetical protein